MKYMSEEEYMCCMKYKTSTSQSFQNVLPSFISLFISSISFSTLPLSHSTVSLYHG